MGYPDDRGNQSGHKNARSAHGQETEQGDSIMKYLQAIGITANALGRWIFGSWTEQQARDEINRARALIGRQAMP